MFFIRKKPRFIPVRHISVEQSLRLQVAQEIGPQSEDAPLLTSRLLAVKAKYGVVDVPFTEGQLTVIRGGNMQNRETYARAA